MNIYYLAFKYKQDVNVAVVTANQLANELLGNTDDIIGLKWNNEHGDSETGISDQGYTNHFFIDGQRCVVEFSDKDPHFFDLYTPVYHPQQSSSRHRRNGSQPQHHVSAMPASDEMHADRHWPRLLSDSTSCLLL